MRNSNNCKLETVAARVLLDQEAGRIDQNELCARFRGEIDLSRGGRNIVVLGGDREMDETHQRFTLDPAMAEAIHKLKPSEDDLKNISAPCFVKFGKLSWTRVSRCGNLNTVTEPWLMSPVVLQEMTAEYLCVASARDWPHAVSPHLWEDVKDSCDVLIDVVNNDDAPNNARAERHECHVIEDLPSNVLRHRHKCGTHKMHGVFGVAWGPTKFISRNFSFLKLISHARYCELLDAKMDELIDEELIIIPMVKPPSALTARNRKLVDMLVDTAAGFHDHRRTRVRGNPVGKLVRDLEEMLSNFNSPWDGPMFHFCWKETVVAGQVVLARMHADDAECIRCLKRSKKHALFRHRVRAPTQKDWTALRVSQSWTELGTGLYGLLPRGCIRMTDDACDDVGAARAAPPAHDFGARSTDFQRLTGSRLTATREHFADPATHLANIVMLVASEDIHKLLYKLMKSPSAADMLDRDTSILAQAAQELMTLINKWGEGTKWDLLAYARPHYETDDECISMARKYSARLAAMFHRNFGLLMTMFALASYDIICPLRSPEEKLECGRCVAERLCCHAPLCGRRALGLTGSIQTLVGPFGQAIIDTLLRHISFGGIPKVERCHQMHRFWMLWQGHGYRGPRHLASRHLLHNNLVEHLWLNPDRRNEIVAILDDAARNKEGLAKVGKIVDAKPPNTRKQVIGGNPKQTYMNAAVVAARLVAGSNWNADMARDAEVAAITFYEQEIKDDPDLYLAWYMRYKDQLQERRNLAADRQAAEAEAVPPCASPWCKGQGLLPTSADTVQADLETSSGGGTTASLRTNQRCIEMRAEGKYLVRRADVMAQEPILDGPLELGCFERAKNICHTDNADRMNQIES